MTHFFPCGAQRAFTRSAEAEYAEVRGTKSEVRSVKFRGRSPAIIYFVPPTSYFVLLSERQISICQSMCPETSGTLAGWREMKKTHPAAREHALRGENCQSGTSNKSVYLSKLLFIVLFWRTTCLGVALAKTEGRGILSPQSGRQPVDRGGAATRRNPCSEKNLTRTPNAVSGWQEPMLRQWDSRI